MAMARLLSLINPYSCLSVYNTPGIMVSVMRMSRLSVPKQYLHTGRITRQQNYARKDSFKLLDTEQMVTKDTLLYRNENRRFHKMIHFFGISQFIFWSYLSHFAFTTMKSVKIPDEQKQDKNLSWWKKTDFGQYKYGITIASFMIGWGSLALCWMYTLRSVNFLVLKKGGRDLQFVTFTPFGRGRSMVVPIEKVSAKQSRTSASIHLPLKVQGKPLHYILDMKGTFTNSKLFDYSAGLKRSWAQ